METAIAQLTDAQLTEVGWTNDQIKEVRKYHKVPGFQRNAHQRALCRRYSEAQRQVFAVKLEARFTNDKKAKAPRRDRTVTRWTRPEADLLVNLYLQHVDEANNRYDRTVIKAEFNAVFNRTGLGHNIAKLAGWDARYNVEGYGTANKKGVLYEAAVTAAPARFA